MSRTTRKNLRVGVCTGRNTEYYRDRTRKMRRQYACDLRNIMDHYTPDDAADMIMNPKFPRKNGWDEPTDGTRLITIYNAHEWEEYNKDVNRELRFYKKNKKGFRKN